MTNRVLIVDDEPLARSRLRAQLTELLTGALVGEVVGEASTGIEALALVQPALEGLPRYIN